MTPLPLALAVCLALAACRGEPAARERREPAPPGPAAGEVGARVPEFVLKDVNGREVSSEQFRGKVLLVNFWATWCAPCKVEMPGFQDLANRYGERGFAVVGIALDANSADVEQFARKLGVHYTLLMNTEEVQKQFGGILGIPTTLLIDRDRMIRKKVVGFEYKEPFETALKQLLEESTGKR